MNKTGTSGERASLITANPRIVRSAIKIIIDSVKETFFFFIFIFLQIKNPVDLLANGTTIAVVPPTLSSIRT